MMQKLRSKLTKAQKELEAEEAKSKNQKAKKKSK